MAITESGPHTAGVVATGKTVVRGVAATGKTGGGGWCPSVRCGAAGKKKNWNRRIG